MSTNLQRQHRKLQAMGAELIKLSFTTSDASGLRRSLSKFSGTLLMHATMEEEALYPSLLSHADPGIRRLAERLHSELGGLYSTWDTFMERWSETREIEAHPIRFRVELTRQLARLFGRMKKEDRELYPVVYRLDRAFDC